MPKPPVDDTIRAILRDASSFQSGELAERTGLSRQALSAHLSRAVEGGWLVREGAGRGTRYSAGPGAEGSRFECRYPSSGLAETSVVREVVDCLDRYGPARNLGADSVLEYTLSEIVNNAIDHSGAPDIEVRVSVQGDVIELVVADQGIGAFENLRSGLHFEDHLHALQELSKGKVTTQPKQHTGEGIFFSSKMVERFQLSANGISWVVDNTLADQTVGSSESGPGTRVEFDIRASTPTTAASVFKRFSTDLDFDTTCCVIRLFEHGTTFISRSEAKRLVTNLDRFRKVILDFSGVQQVGQGFVDQVFRVWAHEHPEVALIPEAMNREVEFMVRRGLARAAQDLPG